MNTPHLYLQLCAVIACAIWASELCGQEPPTSRRVTGQENAAGTQVIINEVNTDQFPEVRLFATVLKEGVPLKGLDASNFRVREDEVNQKPLTVEPKLPPLSVVVTLDVSGSMKERLVDAQAAAIHFLDMLGETDSAQVLTFAREVKRLTPMTTSRSAARAGISATVARGDTALYDALYESVTLLKDRAGRKAIVLLSDGVDDDGTGKQLSKHTVREVLALARQVNVPIYVVGLGTELDEATLTQVAQDTGGLYLKTPNASELKLLYASIGEQLAGQYAIHYTSNLPGDGSEHVVALQFGEVRSTKAYTAPGIPGRAEPPEQSPGEEVACYDEAAVNSLVVSLQKTTELYKSGLINILDLNRRREMLLRDLLHLMARGSSTEACLSQELELVGSLYKKEFIDILQWNRSKQFLLDYRDLGILLRELDAELAKAFGLPDRQGAVIVDVRPNTPAQKAGLQAGDVIVAVNGQPVRRASTLMDEIRTMQIGAKVSLDILRKSGFGVERLTVTAQRGGE
jgi:VWFA-related protein